MCTASAPKATREGVALVTAPRSLQRLLQNGRQRRREAVEALRGVPSQGALGCRRLQRCPAQNAPLTLLTGAIAVTRGCRSSPSYRTSITVIRRRIRPHFKRTMDGHSELPVVSSPRLPRLLRPESLTDLADTFPKTSSSRYYCRTRPLDQEVAERFQCWKACIERNTGCITLLLIAEERNPLVANKPYPRNKKDPAAILVRWKAMRSSRVERPQDGASQG